MARRSDHSRDELKALVLDCARSQIESDGLDGLTARRIAAAIGYSPGTIYNVFDNLDHVISAVNEETLRALNEDLSTVSFGGDALEDARQVLDVYISFREKHPALWDAVLAHAIKPGVSQPDSYIKEIETSFGYAARAIAPAFVGDAEGLRLAVDVLWSSLQGIFSVSPHGLLATDVQSRRREMAEFLVETYLKGLQA